MASTLKTALRKTLAEWIHLRIEEKSSLLNGHYTKIDYILKLTTHLSLKSALKKMDTTNENFSN